MLRDVSQLHNNGVELYEHGQYEAAYHTFVHVLKRLRSVVTFVEEADDNDDPSSVVAEFGSIVQQPPIVTSLFETCNHTSSSDANASLVRSSYDGFFVQPAAEISARQTMDTNDDDLLLLNGVMKLALDIPVNALSISAVTIFNIAVCRHVMVEQQRRTGRNDFGSSKLLSSSSMSLMIKKSLALYEHALQVTQLCLTDHPSCVGFIMLLAGIYTNLAQIQHKHYMNCRTVYDLYTKFTELLMWMESEEYDKYDIIPKDDYDFFRQVRFVLSRMITMGVCSPAA